MKSASSRSNASNLAVVNTILVDKENAPPSPSVDLTNNLNPRQKTKQKYNQEKVQAQAQEKEKEQVPATIVKETEKNKNQMMISSKIEAIEQKLSKLQSLKDETFNEFSSLLSEINEIIPVLDQLNAVSASNEETTSMKNSSNESGLSRLLSRLQKLQQEYKKRRSVSEKRYNYRIDAVNERHSADLLHNKNESESEIAETSVALIHRHMAKTHGCPANSTDTASTSLRSSSSSVISGRKRSLPAINQPVTTCPPNMKLARRQSVAAYPQKINNREMTNSTILNLNQSILVSPKSEADADLLAIKSRISKALKR